MAEESKEDPLKAIEERIKDGKIDSKRYTPESRERNILIIQKEMLRAPDEERTKLETWRDEIEILTHTDMEIKSLDEQIKACSSRCEELKAQKKVLIQKHVPAEIKHNKTDTLWKFITKTLFASDWEDRLDLFMKIPVGTKSSLNKGDYLEALYTTAFALGCYKELGEFTMVYKSSKEKQLVFKNTHDILTKKTIVSSGGAEKGIVDIHLKVKADESRDEDECDYDCGKKKIDKHADVQAYLISVKNYERERDLGSYDVQSIFLESAKYYKYEPSKVKICICLNDDVAFMRKWGSSANESIKQTANYVFGYKDLKLRLAKWRSDFFEQLVGIDRTPAVIEDYMKKQFTSSETDLKDPLPLYFHQKLIADSVHERIEYYKKEGNKSPTLCVGVLPRGGKSFIAGGIINHCKKANMNVLFITSAVNETKKQFKDDLIEKWADFRDFAFIDAQGYSAALNKERSNFVFSSRELFTLEESGAATNDKPKVHGRKYREYLDSTKQQYDLIFMDEAHVGATSETFIKSIKPVHNVPFIMLTATYSRPVRKYIDSNKDLFLWDLPDIQWMRDLGTLTKSDFSLEASSRFYQWLHDARNPITTMYGIDNVSGRIIPYVELLGVERLVAPYMKFPKPYWISANFNKTVSEQLFAAHRQDESMGFHLLEHFQVNKTTVNTLKNSDKLDTWYEALVDNTKLYAVANYITPRFLGDPKSDSSPSTLKEDSKLMNRIFQISKRPSMGKPFSVLFFLDVSSVSNQEKTKYYGNIREKSIVWTSVLQKFSFWNTYFTFVILNDDEDDDKDDARHASEDLQADKRIHFLGGKNLKSNLCQLEQEALKTNRGLCIISGKRASMGISLPCVDIVFLFNDERSADNIKQKSYRALTDSPGKEYGFVVDLNPNRSIEAIFESFYTRTIMMNGTNPFNTALQQTLDNVIWNADAWEAESGNGLPDFEKIRERITKSLVENHYKDVKTANSQFDTGLSNIFKDQKLKGLDAIKKYLTENIKKARESHKETLLNRRGLPGRKGVGGIAEADSETQSINAMSNLLGNTLAPKKDNPKTPESEKDKLENIRKNIIYFSKIAILSLITTTAEGLETDDFNIMRSIQNLLATLCGADTGEIYKPTINKLVKAVQTLSPDAQDESVWNDLIIMTCGVLVEESDATEEIVNFADSLRHEIQSKPRNVKMIEDACSQTFFKVDEEDTVALGENNLGGEENDMEDEENDVGDEENNGRIGGGREKEIVSVSKDMSVIQYGGSILDDSQRKRQNDVLDIIDRRLIPDDIAKKDRGEVFTPLILIRELLFGLRKDSFDRGFVTHDSIFGLDKQGEFCDCDESLRIGGVPTKIWQNPNSTFLDPANGIGNFPIVAFYKLDYELGKNTGHDLDKRKRLGIVGRDELTTKTRHIHIIEKMLYAMELDAGNCSTYESMMKRICKYAKPNIYRGDTVKVTDEILKSKFNICNFTVIMQNPPFNSGGRKIAGDEGAETIWPQFHKFGFDKLEDNGYGVFIHPSIWRVGKLKETIEVKERVMNSTVIYMRFIEKDKEFGDKQMRFKDTDVRVDSYIIQKLTPPSTSPSKKTYITDIFGKINHVDISIDYIPFIPNSGFEILHKLYTINKEHKLKIMISKKTKEKGRTKYITNISDKHGAEYDLTEDIYENTDKVKICLPGSTTRWPVYFVDKKGEYMSDRYILCNNVRQCEKQAQFMSSKLINFLVFVCHYEVVARVPIELFLSIPDIEHLDFDTADDNDIYRALKLSENDIKLIDLSQVVRRNILTSERIKSKTRKVCAKPNPKTGNCSKACEPHPIIAGECIKRCTKTQTRNADGKCVKKPKSGGRRFTYKKRR